MRQSRVGNKQRMKAIQSRRQCIIYAQSAVIIHVLLAAEGTVHLRLHTKHGLKQKQKSFQDFLPHSSRLFNLCNRIENYRGNLTQESDNFKSTPMQMWNLIKVESYSGSNKRIALTVVTKLVTFRV